MILARIYQSSKEWFRETVIRKETSFGSLGRLVVNSVMEQSRWKRFTNTQAYAYVRVTFAGVAAILVLSSGFLPIFTQRLSDQRYDLSPLADKVVGNSVKSLMPQLKLDDQTKVYNFNSDYQPSTSSKTIASGQYRASVATTNDHAITVTDPVSNISLKFVPKFNLMDGKKVGDHLLFPVTSSSAQVVYSLKNNGLKEDVVLPHYQGDQPLTYDLVLPAGAEARMLPDGSLGIYSADPTLFGNISYGSEKDKTTVEKARQNGKKTNLVFTIPSPIVKDANGKIYDNKAKFILSKLETKQEKDTRLVNQNLPKEVQTAVVTTTDNHYTLTVQAKNLNNLAYPISIDPSVRVTSASDFGTGNLEGGIDIDTTNNALVRSGLTGGLLNGWASNTNSLGTARYNHAATVYNGFIYVTGGCGDTNCPILSTVEIASISSSGIGAFSTNSSSGLSARQEHSSVALNGYLYVFGGCSAAASGSNECSAGSLLSSVQYVPLNSNGTLNGTFTTTTALPLALVGTAAVAYNGFIYVNGGCSASSTKCNTPNSATYYASPHADGTIASWTTASNSMTTGRFHHGLATYNGYLYALSGCSTASAGDCTGGTTSVEYAKINADGSIGVWTASSNSLSSARKKFGTVAMDGFIYLIAGCSSFSTNDGCSTALSDTQYATINADGSIGVWKTTQLGGFASNASRYGIAAVGAFGEIFVTGGCSNTTTVCNSGGADSNNQKTSPQSAGAMNSWATGGNAFGTARRFGSTVVYNNYVYLIGGADASSTSYNVISYALVNSDGTLGTWSNTTTTLPDVFWGTSAVAYNGKLYVIGGCKGASQAPNCNTGADNHVYWVPFGASGNITGSFTTDTNTFTTARYFQGSVVNNGYLYIVGGQTSSSGTWKADIQYVQITSSGGLSGAWTTNTSSLSTARSAFGLVTYNGYLIAVGGTTAGSSETSSIEKGLINNNGSITGIASAGTINGGSAVSKGWLGAAVAGGYLYAFGGCSNGGSIGNCNGQETPATYFAKINSDGTITNANWNNGTSLGADDIQAGYAYYNGYLYFVGGSATGFSVTTQYQYAPVYNGSGGALGSAANSSNSFTTVRMGNAATTSGSYVYMVGGCGSANSPQSDVQVSTISSTGDTGTWSATSSLSRNRCLPGTIVYNGRMYVVGGCTTITSGACSAFDNHVDISTINGSTGALGSFSESANTFSTARDGVSVAAYNGYLYVWGGCSSGSCSAGQNDVQYAPIKSDGSIGSFASAGTGFTTARWGQAGVIVNGYMYTFGGCTTGSTFGCTAFLNDTQYAKLNPNGTLASDAGCGVAWCYGTSLPRYDAFMSVAVANGYVYLFGGMDGSANAYSDISWAEIGGFGALSDWRLNPNALTRVTRYSGAAFNSYSGRFYIVGGNDGSTTYYQSANYSSQQAIPRVGYYSRLFDMDKDVRPTKLVLTGTGNGSYSVSFKDALDSGLTFNNFTSSSSSNSLGSAVSLYGTTFTSPARYEFIDIYIDDSQSASFPDTNAFTATDLNFYFNPNTARRLRGGNTFINQSQTNLDAQP